MNGTIRQFQTGATRDSDAGKPDYEGFLSPIVLLEFARYMNKHRVQSDGGLRPSDNWQKGIPLDAYMKSMWRHFHDLWMLHRGYHPADKDTGRAITKPEALAAILFNVQGYFLEVLKAMHPMDGQPKEMSRFCPGDADGLIRCPTGCTTDCALESMDPQQMSEDILRFGVLPPAEHNSLQARVNAAYEAEYTKGHAEETAQRFAAGLPYDDGSRLENHGEPNACGQYAVKYIDAIAAQHVDTLLSDAKLNELHAGFDAESWNKDDVDTGADDFSDLRLKPDPNAAEPQHPKLDPNAPPPPAGRDPVQYDDNFNVWDVWNETWTDTIGSFRDEDEARKVLAAYVESLDRDAREYEAELEEFASSVDVNDLPTSQEIKAEVDERAASFIRDNPLFKVGVLDGDDGAEAACVGGCKVEVYAKEENPVDLFPWVIVALADASDKRRWRVQNNTVYFTDGTPGNVWRESSVMNADSIRDQLVAGTMRVTQAGGAEGAD